MFFKLTQSHFSMFVIVFLWLEASKVLSQEFPSVVCPDKFQYRGSGEKYFGKITIYGALVPSIKVEAQFSQREPITVSFSDRLTLIESVPITEASLQHGFPITYRADFPDPQLHPKLIRIRVNDRTICADNELAEQSTIFTLHHTFYPSLKTLRRPTPTSRLNNPFNGNTNYFNYREPPTEQAKSNDEAICGQEDSSLSSFNADNNEVERGRFPWMAAIFIRESGRFTFTCVGTLISNHTVITAAQSFYNKDVRADQIVVFLGRNDLTAPEIGSEEHEIQALIIHPDYNEDILPDADIALLYLKTQLNFTQFIRPICLGSSSQVTASKVGYHIGWGVNNARYMTPVPKVFQVNIVSEVDCLRSLNLFTNLTTTRTVCAGYLSANAPCFNAAGSGLMVNPGGSWVLRAITSQIIFKRTSIGGICAFEKYVVYCDLSKHITWLRENMEK